MWFSDEILQIALGDIELHIVKIAQKCFTV